MSTNLHGRPNKAERKMLYLRAAIWEHFYRTEKNSHKPNPILVKVGDCGAARRVALPELWPFANADRETMNDWRKKRDVKIIALLLAMHI